MINKSLPISTEKKEQRISLQGCPSHLSAVLHNCTPQTVETLVQQPKEYCVSTGIIVFHILLGPFRTTRHSFFSPVTLTKSSPDSSTDLLSPTAGEEAFQSLSKWKNICPGKCLKTLEIHTLILLMP